MQEEIQIAVEDADRVALERANENSPLAYQATILSGLILVLMGILLVLVGVQSIETERRFFQKMTLQVNRELSDLLAQQFVQSFSAATGLVEDLSRYPSVRRSLLENSAKSGVRPLIEIVNRRNPVLRQISIVDSKGKVKESVRSFNVQDAVGLDEKTRDRLLQGEAPSLLSKAYRCQDLELCIGFGSTILSPKGLEEPIGFVEADFSLDFLSDLVDSVRVGKTGRVLVVDRNGKIVFSSKGLSEEDIQTFQEGFPIEEAFARGGGGVAFSDRKKTRSLLGAYRSVASVSRKGFDAQAVFMPTFTSTVRPSEIPDWMILVQQDRHEGMAMARRMKFNIILLVGIGLIGLSVIARLWWDSIRG